MKGLQTDPSYSHDKNSNMLRYMNIILGRKDVLSSREESIYSCRREALACRFRVQGFTYSCVFKVRLLQP